MSATAINSRPFISVPALVAGVLFVLKLTAYPALTWWQVTAPLWGSFLFGLGVMAVIGVFIVINALIKAID